MAQEAARQHLSLPQSLPHPRQSQSDVTIACTVTTSNAAADGDKEDHSHELGRRSFQVNLRDVRGVDGSEDETNRGRMSRSADEDA